MQLRWLRGLSRRDQDKDAPLASPSEQAAFNELDNVLREFAGDHIPFDEAAGWAKVEARMSEASRASRRLSPFLNHSLPSLIRSAPRVGAIAAVALIVAITVLSVVLIGDGTARAEFFATVDAIDELSENALDDGLITPDEAAALEEQAAIVEQALADDPGVLTSSSEVATTNAIDILTDVQARLSEPSVEAGAAEEPTSNAVIVLKRVTTMLENAALEGRGRGQGNQGQGLGNAPDASDQGGAANGDGDGGQDNGPGRGRGSSHQP